MNCPAKTEPILPDGHNQNPNDLCSDLTTRSDMGKLANARLQREHRVRDPDGTDDPQIISQTPSGDVHEQEKASNGGGRRDEKHPVGKPSVVFEVGVDEEPERKIPILTRWSLKTIKIMKTYAKFVGPGMMISVVRPVPPIKACTRIY